MKINLSLNGEIPSSLLSLFNATALESRRPFTSFIDAICRSNSGNLDCFLAGPLERNIFRSPLFEYCCRFAFLRRLVERGEDIDEVFTDSPAFRQIIQTFLSSRGIRVEVGLVPRSRKSFFSKIARVWGYLFLHLWIFLAARLTFSSRSGLPDAPLTLVDTFVMRGFIDKDRFYPGMLEVLSEEERCLVYFVPTLFQISPPEMLIVWRKMRASRRNFIFKEDYLRLGDYFHAWRHWIRVRKISLSGACFLGFDFTSLIREEISSSKGLGSAMIGLLNYKFAQRLREKGVKLRLVVDWFENQVVDKGWNRGFSEYFPNAPRVGYQGFVTTPFYLCARPTAADRDAGMLPDVLAVTGKALVPDAGEFCPGLKVITAPAFRFSHLYNEREFHSDPDRFTVLAGLSFSPEESATILDLISQIMMSCGADISFMVKLHPATSIEQLRALAQMPWPRELLFVDGPFNEILEQADLLVSGVSSVCMESIARGIPVIVIGNRDGITSSPVPLSVRDDIWRICYTADDLRESIISFRIRNMGIKGDNQFIGRQIRDDYFSPITTEATRHFLNLQNHDLPLS